jgi:uncharacterized membrane protein YdjX (TVP38/TMEM64 family)
MRAPIRLAILAALLLVVALVGHFTGADARLSVAGLRELMQRAGVWGGLLFVGAFALGQLMLVPATVFFVAGTLAWGRATGGAISYAAAVCSVSASFALVRALGGQPLAAVRHARMQRLMAHLDRRPLATVILLRTVFWAAPALNYALALSKVRGRHYVAGSALGLVLPVALVSALVGIWFH